MSEDEYVHRRDDVLTVVENGVSTTFWRVKVALPVVIMSSDAVVAAERVEAVPVDVSAEGAEGW